MAVMQKRSPGQVPDEHEMTSFLRRAGVPILRKERPHCCGETQPEAVLCW
jgi:hypothetical protein